MLQQAPAPTLLVTHELLIWHMQHAPWQQRIPMPHDIMMIPDCVGHLCRAALVFRGSRSFRSCWLRLLPALIGQCFHCPQVRGCMALHILPGHDPLPVSQSSWQGKSPSSCAAQGRPLPSNGCEKQESATSSGWRTVWMTHDRGNSSGGSPATTPSDAIPGVATSRLTTTRGAPSLRWHPPRNRTPCPRTGGKARRR